MPPRSARASAQKYFPKKGIEQEMDTMDTILRIGLINNMGDGALEATERQFSSLLVRSGPGFRIDLSFYSLDGIVRNEYGTQRVRNVYSSLDTLWDAGLDALIVTGREPERPNLQDESYWHSLNKVLEWAKYNTISTVWSCLAAHAAVYSLDGITRQRRASKACGVFECVRFSEHPLTEGLPEQFDIPHSRWNGLSQDHLLRSDYQLLSVAARAGVDLFVRQYRSLFVFFQGHPEYETNVLHSEYLRDLRRFLRGETPTYPSIPERYFDEDTVAALLSIGQRIDQDPGGCWESEIMAALERAQLSATWQASGACIYRNWLDFIRVEKERRRDQGCLKAGFLGLREEEPSPSELILP
jgi:homoserine O-succinyltransferase/O-acetyltransferase